MRILPLINGLFLLVWSGSEVANNFGPPGGFLAKERPLGEREYASVGRDVLPQAQTTLSSQAGKDPSALLHKVHIAWCQVLWQHLTALKHTTSLIPPSSKRKKHSTIKGLHC